MQSIVFCNLLKGQSKTFYFQKLPGNVPRISNHKQLLTDMNKDLCFRENYLIVRNVSCVLKCKIVFQIHKVKLEILISTPMTSICTFL